MEKSVILIKWLRIQIFQPVKVPWLLNVYQRPFPMIVTGNP